MSEDRIAGPLVAVLQEDHLWGSKEVAIPIGAITRLDSGIQLNITEQQVQDLPPVNIEESNDSTSSER